MKKTIIFLIILGTAGCSKNKDKQAPVITITAPANNQTFTAGGSVNITATISDEGEIHGVHLYVTNNSTGIHVHHFEEHVDMKKYDLSQSFTVQSGITYAIELQAEDHVGNVAKKLIQVKGL